MIRERARDGSAPPPTRRRHKPELVLLRLLPGRSPLHRLWAGTKLIVVAVLAVVVSVQPTWTSLLTVTLVVGAGLVAARVPLGAFPRLPAWFWALFAAGSLLTLRSGTAPVVHLGGVELSLGGIEQWALLAALGIVLIIAALLVGWTTPLGEVAPALARLGSPLRRLRLPVDEWVVAVGLAIRCLPLLVDEIRTLVAVRRLRRRETPAPRVPLRRAFANGAREGGDLLTTAIVVALRRARDLAEAIEARGGLGSAPGSTVRPGRADLLVLVGLAAVAAATLIV
jgi:energy-coupling factor transporter transmembrane protein EcfT